MIGMFSDIEKEDAEKIWQNYVKDFNGTALEDMLDEFAVVCSLKKMPEFVSRPCISTVRMCDQSSRVMTNLGCVRTKPVKS